MPKKPSKKKPIPAIVDLHQSFGWKCPACQTSNFCEGVFVEIDPEEQQLMAEEFGGDPSMFATGEIIEKPEDVQCSNCQRTFKVKPDEEHWH
jgi:hypothetical protein